MLFKLTSAGFWGTVSAALVCLGVWVSPVESETKQVESGEYANQPLSGIKLIWAWSVQPERGVDKAVAQAQELGFNAVGWSNPAVVRACRERGMKSFALVSPLSLQRAGARPQVLAEGEEKLPGFDRRGDDPLYPFQHGGEPVPGNKEVLHRNLACPLDPGVIEYGVAEAVRYQGLGYDGICWDFIGYRNYRSCECDHCNRTLTDLQAEGGITRESFYLSSLTNLYSKLFAESKKATPELLIAAHIYPVYQPNVLYGSKVWADYCGETVAWFFQPHWTFEKIRTYTRKTLNPPYEYKYTEAMPMIGFYSDGEFSRDVKGPERLKLELRILKQEGARHFMMCELGHLLRNATAMKAVAEAL